MQVNALGVLSRAFCLRTCAVLAEIVRLAKTKGLFVADVDHHRRGIACAVLVTLDVIHLGQGVYSRVTFRACPTGRNQMIVRIQFAQIAGHLAVPRD